jgi:hypothetical protein
MKVLIVISMLITGMDTIEPSKANIVSMQEFTSSASCEMARQFVLQNAKLDNVTSTVAVCASK